MPAVAVPLPTTTLLVDQVGYLPKDYFLPYHVSVAMSESTPTVTKVDDAPIAVALKETPKAEPMDLKKANAPPVAPSTEGVVVKEVPPPSSLENCDEIIKNLYLGGFEAAKDTDGLLEQGICAVVCCNREMEFPSSNFSPRLDYYRVDVEDMGREPIELFFPEATEFIHAQLLQDRPVLVHCRAGVSRSSTVLLAYLIEYHGLSLHDAFFKLLRLRPTITPNLGFMDKLKAYEEEKLGVKKGSIDVDKYGVWFQNRDRTLEPDLAPE
jgi:hypothetical protein